ncbi:hypothetical protein L596_027152 [Steinernema carpocapsae]|uniref:Uncharacterized protein n=1 Tax=Steinernema carpocapsae TaxID=34508 RepID=A0A4U5M3J5_STECR|nr:hypothetical protein L596_027152 [Steinernema carpocapsae]
MKPALVPKLRLRPVSFFKMHVRLTTVWRYWNRFICKNCLLCPTVKRSSEHRNSLVDRNLLFSRRFSRRSPFSRRSVCIGAITIPEVKISVWDFPMIENLLCESHRFVSGCHVAPREAPKKD